MKVKKFLSNRSPNLPQRYPEFSKRRPQGAPHECGQMVEYLRMNGIVPPASRAKSD